MPDVKDMTRDDMNRYVRGLRKLGLHTRAAELANAWYREHVHNS